MIGKEEANSMGINGGECWRNWEISLGILINVETHQIVDSTGKTKCHFNL